jgi:hypothetical protein
MYRIPEEYKAYYDDYISRDTRNFEVRCVIGGSIIPQSEISSIIIDQDLLSGSEEYTIGNLCVSKLTLVLSSKVVVNENDRIILTVFLKTNEIDADGKPIDIPIPLGKFYAFKINHTVLSKTVEAYDSFHQHKIEKLFESEHKYSDGSSKRCFTDTILAELCDILGISFNSSRIPFNDGDTKYLYRPKYVSKMVKDSEGNYKEVETNTDQVCYGMTVGQALSYIAGYLGGNFIIDGAGYLRLVGFKSNKPYYWGDEGVGEKIYKPNEYANPSFGDAIYRVDCLKVTGSDKSILTLGNATATESTLEIENPFYDYYFDSIYQYKLKSGFFDLIKKQRYKPVKVKVKGDPALQLGDLITIQLPNSKETYQFPIHKMRLSLSGGCSMEIESVCKPKAEKVFNYKGTLTSRLDALEGKVSSINAVVDELNESLEALTDVKEDIDNMDYFIEFLEIDYMDDSTRAKYGDLRTQIYVSGDKFNEQYNIILNNKYLK